MFSPCCFRLLIQELDLPFSLAVFNAGRSIPARIAMIAITTKSSIKVKHWCFTHLQVGRSARDKSLFIFINLILFFFSCFSLTYVKYYIHFPTVMIYFSYISQKLKIVKRLNLLKLFFFCFFLFFFDISEKSANICYFFSAASKESGHQRGVFPPLTQYHPIMTRPFFTSGFLLKTTSPVFPVAGTLSE